MQTKCIQQTFEFRALGRREVTARFDGGPITSDAGGLLLREGYDPLLATLVGKQDPNGSDRLRKREANRTVAEYAQQAQTIATSALVRFGKERRRKRG